MLSLEAGEEGTPLPTGGREGMAVRLVWGSGQLWVRGGLAGVSATGSSSKRKQAMPLSLNSSPSLVNVWLIGMQ